MSRHLVPRALCAAVFLAALAAGGQAQGAEKPDVPEPGEIGKGVMWLPSEDMMVRRMLDMAQVTKPPRAAGRARWGLNTTRGSSSTPGALRGRRVSGTAQASCRATSSTRISRRRP
jgi:hypothetical protein